MSCQYQVPVGEAVSTGILEFVSDMDETPITELPPLVHYVDSDALNDLIEQTDIEASLKLQFEYCGYEITVDETRSVEIQSKST